MPSLRNTKSCARRKLSRQLGRWSQLLVKDDDHVDMRVEFEWHFEQKVRLDSDSGRPLLDVILKQPGVYRVRSGRRGNPWDYDCWYVGRTLQKISGRIEDHLSEDFDESLRQLKRFKESLTAAGGWVEVDRAVDIRINGVDSLRTQPPDCKEDDPDEWEAVEIVLNLIERAGMASNLAYIGRASKE